MTLHIGITVQRSPISRWDNTDTGRLPGPFRATGLRPDW